MGTILASRFKNRRKELNLSQAEVAQGICKQARISKIEGGNYSPGAELLYQLAKKMNVSVEYFFDDTIEEKSDKLEHFREFSRRLLDQRDYENLKYIYDLEMSKKNNFSIADRYYLTWIESMIIFFYEGNKKKGIKLLESLMTKVDEKDTLFLNLSNSLLLFLFEIGDLEKYEERYKSISKVFDKVKISNLEDVYTLIKFKHNYCRFLWLNQENEQAIQEILDTIELCKSYKVSYLLGDMYCLLGNASESFKDKDDVKIYFQKSLLYLKEENNEKLAMKVEQYLKENY